MAGAPFKSFRLASGRSFERLADEEVGQATKAFARQLYKEGIGILGSSQGLVPVDTAALKSSGYVAEPQIDGTDVEVVLGYGGPAAKINPKTGESTDSYALHVHEDLEAFHKVGSAKYLEMPFDQAKEGMAQRMAAGMRSQKYGGIQDLGDPEI